MSQREREEKKRKPELRRTWTRRDVREEREEDSKTWETETLGSTRKPFETKPRLFGAEAKRFPSQAVQQRRSFFSSLGPQFLSSLMILLSRISIIRGNERAVFEVATRVGLLSRSGLNNVKRKIENSIVQDSCAEYTNPLYSRSAREQSNVRRKQTKSPAEGVKRSSERNGGQTSQKEQNDSFPDCSSSMTFLIDNKGNTEGEENEPKSFNELGLLDLLHLEPVRLPIELAR